MNIITSIIFLCFYLIPSFIFAASDTNWFKFNNYENCNSSECDVLKDHISQEFKEVYEFIEKGLTKVEPTAIFTKYDFNSDGIIDFIVTIRSSLHCGTEGCTTFMLLSNEKKYINVILPHSYALQSQKTIGLSKSRDFIFVTRRGCGFWRLDGKKLVHIKNINQCK